MPNTTKFYIHAFPVALRHRLKVYAARHNATMYSVVIEAIDDFITNKSAKVLDEVKDKIGDQNEGV